MPSIASPVPNTPAPGIVDDRGDFAYFWSLGGLDIPIPNWLVEIVEVPVMVRLQIFSAGVCIGLIVAAVVLLIGFYAAMG